MDKNNYVVLTPYMGGRIASHIKCMQKLFADGALMIEIDGCPYIDMAEALLVESALEQTKAEVFMFIEHDMIFNPQDVEKIIQHLLDSKYDALGALYAQKQFNGEFIVGKLNNPDCHPVTFFKPGLHDAHFLGFGFTAIRRSVFESMARHLPYVDCPSVGRKVHPFFIHKIEPMAFDVNGPDLYSGNDVPFYNQMRLLGFDVGADLEIRVKHVGSYAYELEDIGHAPVRFQELTVNYK